MIISIIYAFLQVKLGSTKACAHLLDPRRMVVTAATIATLGCETPAINYERCNGRPYR